MPDGFSAETRGGGALTRLKRLRPKRPIVQCQRLTLGFDIIVTSITPGLAGRLIFRRSGRYSQDDQSTCNGHHVGQVVSYTTRSHRQETFAEKDPIVRGDLERDILGKSPVLYA
jgi:hypothetical protein